MVYFREWYQNGIKLGIENILNYPLYSFRVSALAEFGISVWFRVLGLQLGVGFTMQALDLRGWV